MSTEDEHHHEDPGPESVPGTEDDRPDQGADDVKPVTRPVMIGFAVMLALVLALTVITGYVLFGSAPAGEVTPSSATSQSLGQGTSQGPTASDPSLQASGADRNPFGQQQTTATGTSTTGTVTGSTGTTVGLAEFSGGQAIFWVDDARYAVPLRGTFAGNFVYESLDRDGCAVVRHDATTQTICPGASAVF